QDGSMQELELSCADHERRLEYSKDFEWSVPGAWEQCRLKFKGTPGSRFKLLEFRDRASDSEPPASTQP
ncbi:MAG: hypothetical protein RL033_588, partial [Pseudomonadota bacterium]